MSKAKTILEFWFGHPDESDYGKPRKFWFNKQPDIDKEIRNRFFEDYQKAATGYLDDWMNRPETCLAFGAFVGCVRLDYLVIMDIFSTSDAPAMLKTVGNFTFKRRGSLR